MTTVEMQHSFLSKLTGLNFSLIPFDSYRIEKLLNEAQYKFIERYIPLLKVTDLAKNKLHPLIRNYEATISSNATSNISDYSYYVVVPDDMYKVLNEYITVDDDVVDVKPIDYDFYNANRNNPFKKPYGQLAWRLNMNTGDGTSDDQKFEIIVEEYSLPLKYRLRYIKIPDALNIVTDNTSELRSVDHEEVVDIAISTIVKGFYKDKENRKPEVK